MGPRAQLEDLVVPLGRRGRQFRLHGHGDIHIRAVERRCGFLRRQNLRRGTVIQIETYFEIVPWVQTYDPAVYHTESPWWTTGGISIATESVFTNFQTSRLPPSPLPERTCVRTTTRATTNLFTSTTFTGSPWNSTRTRRAQTPLQARGFRRPIAACKGDGPDKLKCENVLFVSSNARRDIHALHAVQRHRCVDVRGHDPARRTREARRARIHPVDELAESVIIT